MKKNNTTLPFLWGAAFLAVMIGVMLSIRSLSGLGRTTEIWDKKAKDLQELKAMRSIAAEHRSLLNHYAQFPSFAPSLGELAAKAVPGLSFMTRTTETHPALPGWTAKKVSIGLVDITGDDLGRFLKAVGNAAPPWAILDCTLSASPAPGRLAKVELVLETVER